VDLGEDPVDETVVVLVFIGLSFMRYIAILVGGLCMTRLRRYAFAITAAVLAIVPCTPCFALEIPFGIWAIVVLCDSRVRNGFG